MQYVRFYDIMFRGFTNQLGLSIAGKFPLIKFVRGATGCGLKEAKDMVEGPGFVIDIYRADNCKLLL